MLLKSLTMSLIMLKHIYELTGKSRIKDMEIKGRGGWFRQHSLEVISVEPPIYNYMEGD